MCLLMAAAMIVLSSSMNLVPVGWQVDTLDWAVVFPMAYVIGLLTGLYIDDVVSFLSRIIVGCHILFPVRRFARLFSSRRPDA